MTDTHSPAQIESLVRAARWFVRPSDDLRPRTMEAARCYCDDRRAQQRLGGFVIAVLLLMLFSSPAIHYANALSARVSAPSPSEVHQRASVYASQREIGTQWAMAETFAHMRRAQADRLGLSYRVFK